MLNATMSPSDEVMRYLVNEVTVSSDVALPCATNRVEPRDGRPEVRIRCRTGRWTDVSNASWIGSRYWARCYDVGDGILLCTSNGFELHVASDGLELTINLTSGDNLSVEIARSAAVACTVNLGLSISSIFRGFLPLHAASVQVDGRYVAIMAPSGTGKSTLLWSLLNREALFACDDVTVVRASAQPLAYPSVSLHAKLGSEAMMAQGLATEEFAEIIAGNEEYWIPIPDAARVAEPSQLAAIFVLMPSNHHAALGEIEVREVRGGAAISVLSNNMQGLWASTPYINAREYAESCWALAERAPIYLLGYHRCHQVLLDLVNIIRERAVNGGHRNGVMS